ncbi:MAG: UDP-N-acetyl-D-mannosamine dehydrogenase [Sphingomonas sp.]|uniref:UDP-N-acetyl-D-mannosamine dehydrogenase n=1 Tax=Sphingomonas sp. TaxID=28214 RepID=UPI001AC12AD2|nr:UDP-N-acetyl-D-mannosamine dehydrogenase [Sphingomonas sp.]MBN8806894.1 UDP-N-acetyl-D-mannosamine dehydrogenase [Sphingomonas sp.]
MSSDRTPKVSVIGLGYIGLPTAAVIAAAGCEVLGIDVNPDVVATVADGRIHIEEADLDEAVSTAVRNGRLRAAIAPQPADVFLIAVPTPFGAGYVPDISYVLAATRGIAPVIKQGDIVIVESTSPVGTTEQVRDLLMELRPDLVLPAAAHAEADIAVCYCPERVLPGRIMVELVANDRCIGGITPACAERAATFYRRFVKGECVVTTARTAEMVKLTENAFRDVNIAFANELSRVCDTSTIDVWDVIGLANRHPRVNILNPGPGVGGHCIAVDPWFIVHADPQNTPLIRTAREVNDGKIEYVIEKASAMAIAQPGARIACCGLAFKANIDDLRESPALKIATRLARDFGDRVDIVEPYITSLPRSLAGSGAVLVDLDDALRRCDIVLLLVDHDQFKSVSSTDRTGKSCYDTRGIWRD